MPSPWPSPPLSTLYLSGFTLHFLVQEAQWMLDQGIKPDSNCASRGIGYRQALAALQHWHAHPDDVQASQLVCQSMRLAAAL